jgi:hypothetical protein
MRFVLILLIGSFGSCYSQTVSDTNNVSNLNYNHLFVPAMTSTHPLGVFMSRISHNFQLLPEKTSSIAFNISSGNTWLPYVKGYMPLLEQDINAMEKIVWSAREYSFDLLNSPSKTIEFHADGIIRHYQLKLSVPVSDNWELKVSTRAFSVDPGNFPFSTITSDRLIEWFHSNVGGGEDPFARKVYGFNKTRISYTDPNGKNFYLTNGDFIFSGIELSCYYYPPFTSLIKRKIYLNFGLLTGINTSKINPSADIGFNTSINKQLSIGSKRNLQFGLSTGILRPGVLTNSEGVQISNSKFLLTAEILLNYQKMIGRNSQISIGTSYFIQSPYNKKEEFNSMVLTGERISSHWHYAVSHLYRNLSYNTLFITYTKGCFSLSAYLEEDLLVDNAPDVQTGMAVKVNF